jgi:hypothetical protein
MPGLVLLWRESLRSTSLNFDGRGTYSLLLNAIRSATVEWDGVGTFTVSPINRLRYVNFTDTGVGLFTLTALRQRLISELFPGVGSFAITLSRLLGSVSTFSGTGKLLITFTPLIDGTPSKPTPKGSGIYVAYPNVSPLNRSAFPQDNIGKSNV